MLISAERSERVTLERTFLVLGSVAALLGVAAGAFGAHALRGSFEAHQDLERTFRTALEYHLYHSLALVAVAWAVDRWQAPIFVWSGYLFVVGIVIFSGSLYALSLTQARWLGAVTPIGGLAFLAGWALLALGALRS